MHNVGLIVSIAWEAFVELFPYFVIALLISASVDMLYLDLPARRAFRKHGLLGILFTTALGALSPFCSFTVIPLIRKLLRTGVPLSAVMAFWIASPAMDPPIFALTAKEIGLPLATARLLGALALSIGAGLFVLLLERQGKFRQVLRDPSAAELARLTPDRQPSLVLAGSSAPADIALVESTQTSGSVAGDDACACAASADEEDDGAPWWPAAKDSLRTRRNWIITGRNIIKDGISLGKWLVIACVFVGVIRVYLPASLVINVLGDKGLWAIPIAVVISVPLYLNGVGAIPIVGGLLDKGMAPGASITFLLAGAITTIPAMVAVRSVVNNRVFAVYVGTGAVGSIAIGFVCQLIL